MIVEDGSGVPGADSYADVLAADAYHLARDNGAWSDLESEGDKRAALIRATDYLDAHYEAPTGRLAADQGLQFPLTGAQVVPGAVVRATMALALYALKGPLTGPAERGTRSTSEALEGVGTISATFDDAPADPFPAITAMLAPYASLRGGNVVVFRRMAPW